MFYQKPRTLWSSFTSIHSCDQFVFVHHREYRIIYKTILWTPVPQLNKIKVYSKHNRCFSYLFAAHLNSFRITSKLYLKITSLQYIVLLNKFVYNIALLNNTHKKIISFSKWHWHSQTKMILNLILNELHHFELEVVEPFKRNELRDSSSLALLVHTPPAGGLRWSPETGLPLLPSRRVESAKTKGHKKYW